MKHLFCLVNSRRTKRQGTVLCLVNKLLKTNGTVFYVAGIGADFISEMQDGNNILGAAILIAGHFATYKYACFQVLDKQLKYCDKQ